MEAIWTSLLYDIIWIFRNMNWVQTISITIHHHEWNWVYNTFSHSSAYHSLHSSLNMSLWKCLFIATFSLVAHCKSNAQDDTTERNRNAVGINAAITSSYTWQLEAAYHWFPLRYIGIGGGIGFWKQFSTETVPQGKNWKVDENYQLPSNLYLHPSLIFVSPTVVSGDDYSISLFAEPGLILGIPYEKMCIDICSNDLHIPDTYQYISNNKGKWLFYDVRIGILARIEPINIALGYLFSTLDVYTMRRNMVYENHLLDDFYPKAKNIHGAYITISLEF